ncbi:hypothetical protein ES703_54483 [subsurface metagenome]
MVYATDKAKRPLLDQVLPFFLITASIAADIYIPVEVGVLSIFIITLIIYILRRYDFRLLIGTGVFLLVLSAAAFAWRGETNASQIAIPAFYFLATGVVGVLIDFIRSR